MKKITYLFLSLILFSNLAQASLIAVIDSGTDMQHDDIAPHAWTNPGERPGNGLDDENNGFVDDLYGWNFAENNYLVIDYKYLGTLNYDIRRYFEIQTKALMGTATQSEINWMRAKIKDQQFLKKLMVYGNFMHGTHVAGIAVKDSKDAQVLAVKLIPTENPLQPGLLPGIYKDFGETLFLGALSLLASTQSQIMVNVSKYINWHRADIANCSFGTGYPQAKMIVHQLYKINNWGKEPTPEQLHKYTVYFLNALVQHATAMVKNAPRTLFVFAAGNDGSDNDVYPTSPTNIKESNTISVAATLGDSKLAKFSNYGAKMVEVAAPGVGIESAVPGNNHLKVNGTSQAAPYVANIASVVLDANTRLYPGQVKDIIMRTVDRREYLKGKVKTGGIVNKERAKRAAELSRRMSVNMAIARSYDEVPDNGPDKLDIQDSNPEFVLPLPNPIKL